MSYAGVVEPLDLREKGGVRGGVQQTSDRRLFMQLLAFGSADDTQNLAGALEDSGLEGVLYEDVNDPAGRRAADLEREPGFLRGQAAALSAPQRVSRSGVQAAITR